MSDDLLITPGSRKLEIKDTSGNVDAKIETDSSGNLLITNAGGDISIGDTSSDVFIGDGTNNVDIVFEQNGEIRGTSGVTLTLGASGSNVAMGTDLSLGGNDLTNVNDITISGNLTVNGTTTTIDSTNTVIEDSIIELNSGLTGANSKDIGFIFERGTTGNNAGFVWDESADRFTVFTTTDTAASDTVNTSAVANFQAGSFYGNGANLTSLNADNLSSGTVPTGRLGNALLKTGGTMSGHIAMANNNITGLNQLEFNDPGEGIVFTNGSSGQMVLKIIDDSSDNILQYSGTNALFDVIGTIRGDALRIDKASESLGNQPSIAATFDSTGTDGLALISVEHLTKSTAAALGAGIRFKTGDGSTGSANKESYIFMQGGTNHALKYIADRNHQFYVDHHDDSLEGTNYSSYGSLAMQIEENTNAIFYGAITVGTVARMYTTSDKGYFVAGTNDSSNQHLYLGSYHGSTLKELTFSGSNNAFYPQTSAAIDLGLSTKKFKNLHLSGTISSGAITATGVSVLTNVKSLTDLYLSRNDGTSPAVVIENFDRFRFITDSTGNYNEAQLGVNTSNVLFTNNGYAINTATVIDSNRNANFVASSGQTLGVDNTSSTTKKGLALYGSASAGTNPSFGIMFTGTSGSGTHGSVTGDWATYFTMDNTSNRGWIFRNQGNTTNVASISNTGNATFNGTISSGQLSATTTADATPAIIATNTGGINGVIQRWIGDSDSLELRNMDSGDYELMNTQQNNGIIFRDGTGGVEIHYNGSEIVEVGSLGGLVLMSGALQIPNSLQHKDDSDTYVKFDLDRVRIVNGGGTYLDTNNGTAVLHTSTTFGGDVSGTYGAIVVADDSHNHVISNVDGLQTALDAKLPLAGGTMSGQLIIDSGEANPLELKRTSQVGIEFNDTSVGSRYLGVNGGNLFFGGNLNHANNAKVFHDTYHPNADKWTTSRTLTLSGEASGSTSWDGSGNATLSVTLSDSALDNQYVTIGSRYTGDGDALVVTSRASIRIWDVSTASDAPSGASDGLVLSAGWDSSSWGIQQYHDFHSNDLYLRAKNNGSMTSWDRVFHDTYHPNADTWTTARTITLGGDLTGNVSINGSANVTLTAAVVNDSHTHAFNNLTSKTSATGEYSTSGFLTAGRGSGGVSLTHNDGYGNANVTFNHKAGVPEQAGNCGRIVVNTDSTTSPQMNIELIANAGTSAINTPSAMEIEPNAVDIPEYLRHLGDTDTYIRFEANRVRIAAGGTVKLDTNNTYLTGITSSQVTTALGFTPYNATNPSGYTTYSSNQATNNNSSVSFNSVTATSNGSGTNFKVGDDAWIGDINVANTIRVSGVQNANNGYISFGNSSNTALGRAGTGQLTWGSDEIYHEGHKPTYSELGAMDASNIGSGTLSNSRLPTGLLNNHLMAGSNAILRMQETDVTNSPTWWTVADGGTWSIRLNNTGNYPISISTNANNNAVNYINLGYLTTFSAGIDVTGNATITGNLDIGTSSDASRYLYFDKAATGENGIVFKNAGNNKIKILQDSNEHLRIYTNNTNLGLSILETGAVQVARQLEFTQTTTTFVNPGITYHTNNNLYIKGGSAGLILSDDGGQNTIQISDSSDHIKFETGDGTQRAVINSSGLDIKSGGLLIDGTEKINSSGRLAGEDQRAQISGSSTGSLFGNYPTGGSSGTAFIRFIQQNFTGIPGSIKYYVSGASTTIAESNTYLKFVMEADGDFHADGDLIGFSTTTGSDRKLKENIRDLEGSLDKTLKLRGVQFDWKDETKANDQIGFIAQEVEEVLPEVIKEVKTLTKEDETHLTVNYPAVVPLLVEAIKEQQTIINRLEERLNNLENKGEE